MKKTVLTLSIIALAIACAKEPAIRENIAGNAVFTASLESTPSAKTALEGTKVVWNAEDKIKILWDGGSAEAQAESAGESTKFSADVAAADNYFAVYPSSATATLSGCLTVTIPSAQHGTFAEANLAVASTTSSEMSLSFKNLCALAKIELVRDDVAEIRFAGKADEVLCGSVPVSLDASGIPSCGASATGKEIVLTPASGDAFAPGVYYFSVMPGTLSSGLSFSLKTKTSKTLAGKATANAAPLQRSKVLNFGVIDADVLFFDFTQTLAGWPTSNSTSWEDLKNCDSGCKTDNGGTATDNPHRRAQVTYTLDGTDYDFTFADPDNAASHNIYLSASKGVYSGTLRYFGLPAISEKKLARVVMVQNASTKTTEGWFRNVGVTGNIYDATFAVANIEYVSGGEVQNQNTNGATYTYNLSGTAANTVYYVNSPTNASIIKSLKLFYIEDTGDAPGPGPDPQVPETKELHFDFSGEALPGWPTTDKWRTDGPGNITCTYTLDGVDYTFIPTDCGNTDYARVAWVQSSGGLIFYAAWRYLGLPAIEGYKLTKVSGVLCLSSKSTRKAGISKNVVADNTTETNDFVSGGEPIGWTTNGTTYAYNLTGTEANTVYYLTCTNTSIGTSVLDLTYEKVE